MTAPPRSQARALDVPILSLPLLRSLVELGFLSLQRVPQDKEGRASGQVAAGSARRPLPTQHLAAV